MEGEIHDVVQIGMGPVGLTMAALAEQAGLTVAVVERHPSLYGLPRAGHIDHEIVRILQSLDCEGPVMEDSYPTLEYVWVNADGETLMEFDWGAKGISGWHSDYMQYQPVLEAALASRVLEAGPAVTALTGWEAVGFTEHDDHVEVLIERTEPDPGSPRPRLTGERRTLRGRWVIGADGANSTVRRHLDIGRDDLGFNEQWLDVDARVKRDLHFDFDCGQLCDPARPITILPLGKRHRRWEWALLPGEDPADFARPEKAWELLAEQGLGPDDLEIVRQLVYTFEARTATRWRAGRFFLIGDAAHTMPPFMGQGMCSGMRDAKNLAWKLALVRDGRAPDALLDTYEAERRPHTHDWTVISLEAGKVPCTTDPAEAAARDERFRQGWKPPMPDFPQLVDGVLARDETGAPAAPAGELGLQAVITAEGETGLLDDVLDTPGRWQVLSLDGDPREALGPERTAYLESLGAVFVHLTPAVDAEGAYAAWLGERGIAAAVVRPDFYVFGGAADADALQALADELQAQLTGAPRPAAVGR